MNDTNKMQLFYFVTVRKIYFKYIDICKYVCMYVSNQLALVSGCVLHTIELLVNHEFWQTLDEELNKN